MIKFAYELKVIKKVTTPYGDILTVGTLTEDIVNVINQAAGANVIEDVYTNINGKCEIEFDNTGLTPIQLNDIKNQVKALLGNRFVKEVV